MAPSGLPMGLVPPADKEFPWADGQWAISSLVYIMLIYMWN